MTRPPCSPCLSCAVCVLPPPPPPPSRLNSAAHTGEWSTQFLTILPLAYICTCTYFALFRINAFNYNKLLKGATTGAALMQNGSLMCRFAAPTCWNFLHMIHMTGTLEGGARTVFEEVGGWGELGGWLDGWLDWCGLVCAGLHYRCTLTALLGDPLLLLTLLAHLPMQSPPTLLPACLPHFPPPLPQPSAHRLTSCFLPSATHRTWAA